MSFELVESLSCGEYTGLVAKVYAGNDNYKDSLMSTIRSFINKESAFCSSTYINPIGIAFHGSIIAAAVLILPDRDKDLLQVAYFEAMPDCQAAVNMLLDKAKELGKKLGAKRIAVGTNGHINYGLGILANKHDVPVTYGSNYNPPYYLEYFTNHDVEERTLTSFQYKVSDLINDREQRLLNRIYSKYTFRSFDIGKLEQEADTYTKLNNISFSGHPYYYERTAAEDFEVFESMRDLMEPHNLIFAERDGEAIGFLLWYPDYLEHVEPQGSIDDLSISNFSRHKSFKKCKITEIGVLPEYQKSGVVLGLLHEFYQRIIGKFEVVESGWVADTNSKSRNLCFRWAEGEHKTYKVFEMAI